MSWRKASLAGAVLMTLSWPIAEATGQIESVALVNRVSFLTAIFTFVAAWRADVPTDGKEK